MKSNAKYQDLVIKDGKLIGDWDNLYKNFDDPWMQSILDHKLDTRRQISILACQRLREEHNSLRVLELGCGFGFITQSLTELKFKAVGMDISENAIAKAKEKNPESIYRVGPFDDFDFIREFNPDILIMAELTWYVLENLDTFMHKLKGFAKLKQNPVFLIHLLNTYKPGVQKYGLEKFKNHGEILKYFNLDYLESGYIETRRPDDPHSGGSYFIAQVTP